MNRRYYTQNVFTSYGWTIPQTSNPMELWPFAQQYYRQYGNGQYGAQYTRFGRSGGGVPFKPRLSRCQSGTCPPWLPPGLIMTTRSGPQEFAILRDLANLCTVTPQQPLPFRSPELSPGCPPAPAPPGTPGSLGTCWGGSGGAEIPTASMPVGPDLPPPRRPGDEPGFTPARPETPTPGPGPTYRKGVKTGPTYGTGIKAGPTYGTGFKTDKKPPRTSGDVPIPATRTGNPHFQQGTTMNRKPKEWAGLNFGRRSAKWTRATGSNGGCTSCRIKADPAGFTTGISVAGRKTVDRARRAKARVRASGTAQRDAQAAFGSPRLPNQPPMARFGHVPRLPNQPPMARFGHVPQRVANVPPIRFGQVPNLPGHVQVSRPVSPYYSQRAGHRSSPQWHRAEGSSAQFLRR